MDGKCWKLGLENQQLQPSWSPGQACTGLRVSSGDAAPSVLDERGGAAGPMDDRAHMEVMHTRTESSILADRD